MLKIYQDKLIFNRYGNPKEDKEVNPKEIPAYLACELKIEKGVTFGRIFELILLHKDLFNLIYDAGQLYGHDIGAFEEQFNMEDDEDKKENYGTIMEHLEVSRIVEHYIDDDGEESWEFYLSFGGYGEWGGDQKDENGDPVKGGISVSFSPLNQLKKYPIIYDDKVKVYGNNFKTKELNKIEYETRIPITLFDFIGAILNEITWHGIPKSKQKFIDELNETVKRIEDGKEKLFEMKEDEDGNIYFEDEDGNKEYLNDDEND